MRTLTRSKAIAALAAGGLLVTGGGIAYADNLISDGDGVVATKTDSNMSVGSVCAGSTGSRSIPVYVTRQGTGTNTYANGSTVTISGTATTGTTVESGSKTVTLPTTWEGSANGTVVGDVAFTVGYTAPTTLGPFTSKVTFAGAGTNTSGAAITRADELAVSGTVIACDSTAPVITPTVTGTLGNDGWYTSDVSLAWNVVDTESTISSRSGCESVSVTSDQAATTYTCSATSAGGTGSNSVSIKRDATAPVITPGDVDDTTWRSTPLSVDFTASDATSGLANGSDAGFTLTASDESASATAGTTDSRTVTDNAGNSATRTLSARIDSTGPVVSYTSATGTAGTNGWYTGPVTATFTATDALSGPASQSATVSSGTTEGSAVELSSPLFTDNAGNSTAAGAASESFKIDLTDPAVPAFASFPAQAYATKVPAAPTCSSSDTGSGLAKCEVTGYSTAVGSHTLTATATDNAGRTSTETMTYIVSPWTLKGFYSPVDMNGVWNSVKGGSTVPLKFEAFAGSELTSTSDIKSFTQRVVNCSTSSTLIDDIEVTTTGGTSLRYDTAGGQFVQNWQTPKKPGTCYVVTMTTQDGSTVSANFMLK